SCGAAGAAEPIHEAEFVFPLHHSHNHAPSIVECPNGDLLVSWYRGSGERKSDDVAVFGARKAKDAGQWGAAFLMADTPGFPDCNTCMMVDRHERLWLFWPVIIANSWESCLTHYKVAVNCGTADDSCPSWSHSGTMLLKPDDFEAEGLHVLDAQLKQAPPGYSESRKEGLDRLRQRLGEKLYQRLGWQPRCKPTVLPSGRILLPLYSDTYSISIMAVSDDDGKSWYASKPLLGFGNIQPAVLRRNDGSLVAYMRENGVTERIRICESKDDGISWTVAGVSELPNPGSGLDGVRLKNGHWLLVYNDTTEGRSSLAVSVSDDEGATWRWTRHLEKHESGQYHYPAVIQSRDDRIHIVYSYFVTGGKTMKHVVINEAWVLRGDN
ncbi:MAG TPA: neuraminidase (sialidase)-like protein, partial [Planctomycetes bacterium]|nr:neuraminidase (sialidase)-like protein [Planctomycetota bacterium]